MRATENSLLRLGLIAPRVLASRFMTWRERLIRDWYAPGLTLLTALLVPVAASFAIVVRIRRTLYRIGVLAQERLPVPVLVVGNITVGGTGKTPLVIALAHALHARGWHPGVISRGYARMAAAAPRVVDAQASTDLAGDEPLLMARNGLLVAVGARRTEAGRMLLAAYPQCDVLIADDGLQHYALARDVQIAVIDGSRGFGNGWQLPAGPLRESLQRLSAFDAVVINGEDARGIDIVGAFRMQLTGSTFRNLIDATQTAAATAFAGDDVHAIAGIGNPERFFATLRRLGIKPVCHAFPDHHRFVRDELALPGATAILMTEKDAVKCAGLIDARCWFLPVVADVDAALIALISTRLDARRLRVELKM